MDLAARIRDRLLPAIDIDDAEASMADSNAPVVEKPFAVRAPMAKRIRHRLDQSTVGGRDNPCNAAHQKKPCFF
jgi:hypothetical protein